MDKRIDKHQTIGEEISNSISHGVTALTAIGGMIVLIVYGARSDQEWSLFSALFYGGSLVLLYTFSTLYHSLTHKKAKKVFNILDHCGIFLLIAGTYTPVMLITIGGVTGWVFFGVQWTMAIIGIVLKVFYTGRYNALSTALYAVMGWIIVIKLDLIKSVMPESAFWLLASGGLCYTVGIAFYIVDYRMKFSHFIWHLFVMAGSILHFLMMVMYIFN
ncbi:hemolysin III family protein [Reichenbachiella agarivorans]|uniref:Hemolysin III family protein n=1 Tax=Reichenbachiella agarivorans TaxID=2979464 RepID=A0ABY6CS08_9BACT|nr:hemolysin III family protein [Reichenbachiella agarivorans]UXP33306.1 hemolysin III family protein [Reichenbachiella agarivorans]